MALWPIRFPFSLAFFVVGCSRVPVTTIIFTILGHVILLKTHMEPENDTFQVWNFQVPFSALSFLEDVSATLSNLHVPLASWVENHSKTYLPGIAPAWGLSQKLARTMGTSRAKGITLHRCIGDVSDVKNAHPKSCQTYIYVRYGVFFGR